MPTLTQAQIAEILTVSLLKKSFESNDIIALYQSCDRILHSAIGLAFFELALNKQRKFERTVFEMAKSFYVFNGDLNNTKHFIGFNEHGKSQVKALLRFIEIATEEDTLMITDPLYFSSKRIDLPLIYENLRCETPQSKRIVKLRLVSSVDELRKRFKKVIGVNYRENLDRYFCAIQDHNNDFIFKFMGAQSGYKGIDSLDRLINKTKKTRRIQNIIS